MNGYCKAYRLHSMQSFPFWWKYAEPEEDLTQEEDQLCYLWDDYVVRSSPIRREKTLFACATAEWREFCQTQLEFKVPEGVVQTLKTSQRSEGKPFVPQEPVPFTCGQQWLIEELRAASDYYCNMHFFSEPFSQALSVAKLEDIVLYLVAHHDALRLHITEIAGQWRQFITDGSDPLPLTLVCLLSLSPEDQKLALDCVAREMQMQVNTFQGYLWHAAFCETHQSENGRMLWVINHFLSDEFSNDVLRQDFRMLYQQAVEGKALRLPPKTTSFQVWARRISAYLHSPEAEQEMREYWLTLPWHRVKAFPLDFPAGYSLDPRSLRPSYGTRSSAQTVTVCLGAAGTHALLAGRLGHDTQPLDAFLTAMTVTLTGWSRSSALAIFVEDHARLTQFDDINLACTVGYISHARRLLLDLHATSSLPEALESIKKQLRQAPNNGRTLDWFLRRGDGEEIPGELKQLPFAEIYFNFHGRVDSQAHSEEALFQSFPTLDYPEALRNHVLICDVFIYRGDIWFQWEYSRSIHRPSSIESVAERFIATLRNLISLCVLPLPARIR